MDYTRAIGKAIEYLELKLTSRFSLEDVADIANFSMYHFHRLFVLNTGHTPKEYLRKRRLSEAARELTFNFHSIKEIARLYQFESQASFTRAFGKQFGISPGRLRRTKVSYDHFTPLDFWTKKRTRGSKKMDVRIIEKEPMKVIGISTMSTLKNNTIPKLWDEFNRKAVQIENIKVHHVALGVCPPVDVKSFDENTPFKYIACMIVENFDKVPKGMETYEIPAQKYAVITHKGPLDTLQKTYEYFYNTWINDSENEFSGGAEFELYDKRFMFGEVESEMDIYRPIK